MNLFLPKTLRKISKHIGINYNDLMYAAELCFQVTSLNPFLINYYEHLKGDQIVDVILNTSSMIKNWEELVSNFKERLEKEKLTDSEREVISQTIEDTEYQIETEFGKIENFQTEVIVNADEYEEYIETADVYSYAQLKDTHEEVVTIKGEWTPYNTIRKEIVIEDKKYYSDFTVIGTKKDKFVIGPITINFIDNKVHIDLKGTLQKRVKDLKFILSLFKYQYIMIDDVKLEFPFVNQEKINKNIDLFNKQLNYFEKIVKVFKFFNTEFDMNYEDLSEIDLKNLHRLMNLFDGCFGDEIKELQKYFIQINKYKFIFLIVKSSKKLYNFYSKEIIDNMICFFKFENKEVKTSIYANLVPEEFIGMNNFDGKLIIKSFKNIELTEEVCNSINQLLLMFISVYDETKNREFINIADSLSQINCKNRNNDIDIINAKQIKYRKKGCLSTNDKKILSDISKKEENKENYQILCCISLLINNYYSFEENFSKMSKKAQADFKKFPIYNLVSQT